MDWGNIDAVKTYAKRLGDGMVVFKHPDRTNYNITHSASFFSSEKYKPEWLVFKTGGYHDTL